MNVFASSRFTLVNQGYEWLFTLLILVKDFSKSRLVEFTPFFLAVNDWFLCKLFLKTNLVVVRRLRVFADVILTNIKNKVKIVHLTGLLGRLRLSHLASLINNPYKRL